MGSLFSRFSSLAEVIKVLSQFQMDDLKKAIDAVKQVQAAEDMKDRVLGVLVIADVITDYIPGEADDAFVDGIAKLAKEDELWELIAAVQAVFDGGKVNDVTFALAAKLPDGLPIKGDDGEDKKFVPWSVLIQIIPVVIQLINLFTKEGE